MDQALIALYHLHVAAAFDRQLRLAEFLEREAVSGKPYLFTTSTATLEFGNTVQFCAFDIGSHADPDSSWLWVWCDPNLKLTPPNEGLGEKVRRFGQAVGIEAFTADVPISCDAHLGPDLSPVAAHVFASILAQQFGFDAYYTMPFAHGRFVALIKDDRLRAQEASPASRILLTFPQLLSAFPILDHRTAFVAYAKSYSLNVEEDAQTVRIVSSNQDALRATFDPENRMIDLTGTFNQAGNA
jgi:hypothetical protein